MSSNTSIVLCVFAVTWIAVSGLGTEDGYSTRRPDDATQDDDDTGPQLLISSVLFEPYLRQKEGGEDGDLEGFIPDLMQAICETGHVSCDYVIELAADGKFGTRNNEGKWTGMIGEVMKGQVDMAAAPITITDARRAAVNFSIPFVDVGLAVVGNSDDGIDSLSDLLASNVTLGGVDGGSSLETIRNHPEKPYSDMWSKIDSKQESRVSSVSTGAERVRDGGYAMVMPSDMARYYTSHSCKMVQIGDTFSRDQLYAFAFPKQNDDLEESVNKALGQLKEDKQIVDIYSKWFDATTCGAGGLATTKTVILAIFAAVLLLV